MSLWRRYLQPSAHAMRNSDHGRDIPRTLEHFWRHTLSLESGFRRIKAGLQQQQFTSIRDDLNAVRPAVVRPAVMVRLAFVKPLGVIRKLRLRSSSSSKGCWFIRSESMRESTKLEVLHYFNADINTESCH